MLIYIMIALFVLAVILCIWFNRSATRVYENESVAESTSVSHLKQAYTKHANSKHSAYNLLYVSLPNLDAIDAEDIAFATMAKRKLKKILLSLFVEDGSSQLASYMEDDYLLITQSDVTRAKALADEVNQELAAYLINKDFDMRVRVVFGAFFGHSGDVSFDDAVERAKLAFNYADQHNKAFTSWNYSMHQNLTYEEKLKKNIKSEVKNNHFFLEWQPVVDIETGKVVNAEVLARLNSDNKGIIPPGRFIPIISESGMCEEFDYYIFEKGCKWMSNRIKMNKSYIGISVNFFRSTIAHEDFVDRILETLNKYNVPAGSVRIEILEENLRADDEFDSLLVHNLNTLRKKGVLVMLDDFGANDSSFSDVQNYPIDIIKIDRSIIVNSTTPVGHSIFKNIVNMAKEIGVSTICEGVDCKEQYDIVKEAGCDMVQGFYCYTPMPLGSFEKLLEDSCDADSVFSMTE